MIHTIKDKIQLYGQMIKFSHTIFALPFALSAMVMAWETHAILLWDFIWIIVAMVAARSAAMGFNRIADAKIDAKNARTAMREIPSGRLSVKQSLVFVLLSSLVFILASGMLSALCLKLAVPVLLVLMFYSYTKRFTRWCHLFLGFAISLAPMGAWIAITGTFSWSILFLSLGLLCYISGFDILYACQDIEFDRESGLFSLPAAMGAQQAMKISSSLHIAFVIFLLLVHLTFSMHPVFLLFILGIAILLVIEHRLVRPDDLTQINMAFFHMNSVISIVLFAGVLIQGLLK